MPGDRRGCRCHDNEKERECLTNTKHRDHAKEVQKALFQALPPINSAKEPGGSVRTV